MSNGKKREWFHNTAGKFKHLFGKKSSSEQKNSSKESKNAPVRTQSQRSHQAQQKPQLAKDLTASAAEKRQLQQQEELEQLKSPSRAKSPEPNRVWNMPTSYLASALAAPPPKPTELPSTDGPRMKAYDQMDYEPQQREQYVRPARQLESFWSVPTHYLASMLQAPPPKETQLPLSEDQRRQLHMMQQQRQQQQQQQPQQQQQQQQRSINGQLKLRQVEEQLPELDDALLPFADVVPRFATDTPLVDTIPVQQSTWIAPRSNQREQELNFLQRERERERDEMAMQVTSRVIPRSGTREQLLRRARERERDRYYMERELREREAEHQRENDTFRDDSMRDNAIRESMMRDNTLREGGAREYAFDERSLPRQSLDYARNDSREFVLAPTAHSMRDMRDPTPYYEKQNHERNKERRMRDMQSSPRHHQYDRTMSFERINDAYREQEYVPASPNPQHTHTASNPYYNNGTRYESTSYARDKLRGRSPYEARGYSEQRPDGRCNTCVDTRRTHERVGRELERVPTVEQIPDRFDRRYQTHMHKSSSMRRVHTTPPPTLLADEDDRFSSDSASQLSISNKAYDLQAQDLWMPACEIRNGGESDDENIDDTMRWLDPLPPVRPKRGYIEENDYLPPKMPPPPRPDERRRMRAAEKHRRPGPPPPVRTPFNLPSLLPPFRMPPTTYEAF